MLAVNVGTTSLKYAVFASEEEVLCRGRVDRLAAPGAILVHVEDVGRHEPPLKQPGLLGGLDAMIEAIGPMIPELAAVAFKVVHGGEVTGTVLLDERAQAALERYAAAAPAHNPPYLSAIRHLGRALPDVPLIGSFETAFHAEWSPEVRAYAVPADWARRHGVRRYGFHGASHRYVSERMSILEPGARRLLSCHLGGSSSICAIADGRSMDATMGFSPQSGLPQAERVGDLDPFALVHLGVAGVSSVDAGADLASRGGLLGLSGLSGDLQELESAEARGHPGAAFALRVYALAARKAIGSLAATMAGLDAVAFTGGMGENSPLLRRRICDGLEFLGIALDSALNERASGEARVSTADAKVGVWVVPTDEERILVRETLTFLEG